jgi:hypothetical protein
MDKTAADLAPALGVIAAHDDYVCGQPQIAQGSVKPHRLLCLVSDLRLYDKEVKIAVPAGFAPGVRAEQDHLGIGGSSGQTASRLHDQSLVNRSHSWKS